MNLDDLENRLRYLAPGEHTGGHPHLRDRVMRAVNIELTAQKHSTESLQLPAWYWPAIAAVILIVMNLSLVSASRDSFSLHPMSGNQITAEIHALEILESQQQGQFK